MSKAEMLTDEQRAILEPLFQEERKQGDSAEGQVREGGGQHFQDMRDAGGLPETAFEGRCHTGQDVWTDGTDVYYSSGINQYVYDKETFTWSEKTWNGITNFDGRYVWTDGEKYYYSNGSEQYQLDKATSTWTEKIWTGLTSFYGYCICLNIWRWNIAVGFFNPYIPGNFDLGGFFNQSFCN